MQVNRRNLIAGAAALTASVPALAAGKLKPFAPASGSRSRMVYVNDLSGDVDGLFATAHILLSNTSRLQCIVGTAAMMPGETSKAAAVLGRELVELAGKGRTVPVHEGSIGRFGPDKTVQQSPGVQAIIDEAMRTDTDLPLFIAVGGGLTEVASALKIEPKIAEKAILVWIGGGSWPAGGKGEYNFGLDPHAARYIYNETQMPIWQIPDSVYRTCLLSVTEVQAFISPHGKMGEWLYRKLAEYPESFTKAWKSRLNTGETWTMGDNPLAVLTSLGDWVPNFSGGKLQFDRTSAGLYDEVICPTLNADGTFTPRSEGRKVRIYKTIDTRLMFSDFFAKLAVNFPAK